MSICVIHRPARQGAVSDVSEGVTLPTPPVVSDEPPASWVTYLFPVLGSVGALVFALANPRPLFMVGGAVFMLCSVAMGVGMYLQQRTGGARSRRTLRTRYHSHLDGLRLLVRQRIAEQHHDAWSRHPNPQTLYGVVGRRNRLWERRPTDSDFLEVRVGTGSLPVQPRLEWPVHADPLRKWDPVCEAALRRLIDGHGTIGNQPIVVSLRAAPVAVLGGARAVTRGVARAMVAQLATFHAPDDVRIGVLTDSPGLWDWLKWLPHTEQYETDPRADVSGGPGHAPPRLLARDEWELERLLGPALSFHAENAGDGVHRSGHPTTGPHLVVIVDQAAPIGPGHLLSRASGLGVSVVCCVEDDAHEPSDVDARLHLLDDGSLRLAHPAVAAGRAETHPTTGATADSLTPMDARVLARSMAKLRLAPEPGVTGPRGVTDLGQLIGWKEHGGSDLQSAWADRHREGELCVPLGLDGDGRPVKLDLRESALGGMGPHGLVAGATGSGKSELLRTLVTGLVATHGPEDVALLLIDYKGGATFAGFEGLPHLAGMVTNLSDDRTLIERMRLALLGEMDRRQRLLGAAGNVTDVRAYRQARATKVDLPPLPSLLVIVDEFSELLAHKPELVDLFVAIGRLGRSLGIHLLLSTQRLDESRLRGLESHLSYRIALRTFSTEDSRAAIGRPDAFALPKVPGAAILKVDTSVFQRLRVASASTPRHLGQPAATEESDRVRITAFTGFTAVRRTPEAEATMVMRAAADQPDDYALSLMDAVVEQAVATGLRTHQIWKPPLGPSIPLGAVLPPLERTTQGLRAVAWPSLGQLTTSVGVVDLPALQRQDALVLELDGAGGNLAIAGASRMGKSTALRTLITSLAATHTPAEIGFYGLDFGGGQLAALADLPHVGTVAERSDPELCQRIVAHITALLDDRQRNFSRLGIDDIAALRRSVRAQSGPPAAGLNRRGHPGAVDSAPTDVFLVVDGWAALRADAEGLHDRVAELAAHGLNYGIHVVITTSRWMDVRPKILDSFGARIELSLSDAADSLMGRGAAASLARVPGRALIGDGTSAQLALPLPVLPSEGPQPLPAMVRAIADAWPGPRVPAVRLLPLRVGRAELTEVEPAGAIPLGLAEPTLSTAGVELFGSDPHLLVLGDSESGKTGVLRTLLAGLTDACTPDEAQVLVVDYRRGLLDAVDDEHLLAYAVTAESTHDMVAALVQKLRARQPRAGSSLAELRAGATWQGPDTIVVVDDYDLVPTSRGNPLDPLVEFLPQARDLGLHLMVARRVGGMARAGFEPVLSRMRELGTPGFILSGTAEEGPLIGGHRAAEQPPGRGLFVRRGHPAVLVQAAWTPPA